MRVIGVEILKQDNVSQYYRKPTIMQRLPRPLSPPIDRSGYGDQERIDWGVLVLKCSNKILSKSKKKSAIMKCLPKTKTNGKVTRVGPPPKKR